jgi:hypothetical protein
MTIGLRFTVVGALVLALGCTGKTEEATTTTEGDTETGIPPLDSADGTATGTTRGSATDTGVGEGDGDSDTASDPTAGPTGEDGPTDGTATDGGGDPGNPLDCGGTIYACGNGMDDDGDGFVDLFDPECTGPCDDDESSFQTGIPGDNMDCKQDCFFDGNSGQGDDGCVWDLRCDPANPGEFIGCEYTGGNNCDNQPPNQEQGCIEYCEPFVPPGCDCFGCCTVQTPEGPIDIFLNSDPDCSLDNLDACTQCTSQIDDCGTPCVPEDCQVCFGETEPPEGCGGEQMCVSGDPCDADQADSCPPDYFCYLGCCYPPPPG